MSTPNFICIGAQKTGTTSLHDILKEHPEIYLPEQKETHFFNRDEIYQNGYDWWLNTHFSDVKNEKVIGEINPDYIFFEKASQRIKEHLGTDIKIIMVLRHPVNRAYSQFLMAKSRGFESLTFEEAVAQEQERMAKGEYEQTYYSYLSRGRYAEQIERYIHLFGKENMLILTFEKDIKKNLKQTVARIQEFLGVTIMDLDTNIQKLPSQTVRNNWLHRRLHGKSGLKNIAKRFISKKKRAQLRSKITEMNNKPLTDEERLTEEQKNDYFKKYYPDEIDRLESLLNMDFSHWNSKTTA